MSINIQTGTQKHKRVHKDTRVNTVRQNKNGVGLLQTEKKKTNRKHLSTFFVCSLSRSKSSDKMFVDKIEETSRINFWAHCRNTIGVRTGQFCFGYMSTFLFHPIICQNINQTKTVKFTTG